jgi:hypothetical protein
MLSKIYILEIFMKLSNKQGIMLLAILKDCLYVSNGSFGGYTQEQLVALYNELVNQQDDTIRELGE